MASLFIKDVGAADMVRAVAKRLGTTQTEAVRLGMVALEKQLDGTLPIKSYSEKLADYRRMHPLPPLKKRMPDKEFYDWISGEEDVHDPFR